MRIYLDNCVYQDLKREENKDLYNTILDSKGHNLYLYSKAHLYDLSRDKSDYKFEDLKFIETITDNNSLAYNHKDKKFIFEYLSPSEFYNMYDWSETSTEDIINVLGDNPFINLENIFKNIPLDFNLRDEDLEKMKDAPNTIKELLNNDNFYDYYLSFLQGADKLSSKGLSDFKELLKYLHNMTSLYSKDLVSTLTLEGFDMSSLKVLDRDKLRESYIRVVLGENNTDSYYDGFCKLYSGLEFYGLVKGKTRSQFLMNFINDGKHACFGTCVDIIVSKDKDFINKTTFLYDLLDISTSVLDIDEFYTFLSKSSLKKSCSFTDLLEESFNEDLEILGEEKTEGMHGILKKMNITYGGMINTITYIDDQNTNKKYIYFSVEDRYNLKGTIVKELCYLTSCLIRDLGIDVDNNGELNTEEIIDGRWSGRTWCYDSLNIYLNYEIVPYILISS